MRIGIRLWHMVDLNRQFWSGVVRAFALFRILMRSLPMAMLLMSALLPLPACAQGGSNTGNNGQHREVPNLDVIMVIDESETMWNHTDTEGVRVNTVNFFIDMLSSERSGSVHRLGIVAFGTEPTVIPYTLLGSQEAAEELKEQYAAVHKSIESEPKARHHPCLRWSANQPPGEREERPGYSRGLLGRNEEPPGTVGGLSIHG